MYTEHCVANLSSNLGEKSEECMCCMIHNISRMCSGGKEESENLLTPYPSPVPCPVQLG